MQSKPLSVQVQLTEEFQRRLRTLSKKYRHIRSDIQPIIAQLQAGDSGLHVTRGGAYVKRVTRLEPGNEKDCKRGCYKRRH